MRLRAITIVYLSLLLLLVACDQTEDSSPTATAEPPTPTQEALVDTPVPPPTATEFVRPTLPPTWTPEPTRTLIPAGGASTAEPENAGEPAFAPATINPACGTFGPNRAETDTEFRMGNSPRIAWTMVDGAALYRVVIINEGGLEVHNVLVEDTFLDVNPDVFAQAGAYGWDVVPLNGFGEQMCIGRGDMLLAQ